jgi:hypothetical protein
LRKICLEVIGEMLLLIFLDKGRLIQVLIALVDAFGAVLLRSLASRDSERLENQIRQPCGF